MDTLPIRPFAFDRTFTAPSRPASRPHRRKTDAAALALEVEALRAQVAQMEQMHRDELARTRTEAFECGLNHARTEREAAVLSSIDALQASLEAVAEQYEETRVQVVADSCEVALAAAEILAGRAVEAEPEGAIDEAIGRALAQVARGQEIEVRVHPDLVEPIERRIERRQAGDRRRLFLTVTGDPAIAPGDARLCWERGGAIVDAASRRQAILDELAPLMPAAAD